MRRFLFLAVLCLMSLPVSLSVTGCYLPDYGKNFCTGLQSGPSVTATTEIILQPSTYGVSLNFAATNEVVTPTAYTCKGTTSGLKTFTYGTSDPTIADVSPTGQLCGGTWNRNSGNGVADYTTCVATNKTGIAYITASGGGATSNVVPVFVHPVATSVLMTSNGQGETCSWVSNPANGQPSPVPFTVCSYVDPSNPAKDTPAGCVPAYMPQFSPQVPQSGCVSQNNIVPLAVTVCTGGVPCAPGSPNDITCDVGHLTYTPQNTNIVTIDQNGVATAHQPGATVISATVAQATSSAGYFFTCPPANIKLSVGTTNQGQPPLTPPVTLNQSNIQPLTTTVLDTKNNPITGLALTYMSTSPITTAVSSSGSVTATFPSDADIVAQCMPPTCNPTPQNEIGELGTGLPVTSNPIAITTPGPNSTILYMSSPWSYGFVPVDFLLGTVGTPVQLPYLPNSMVMNQMGTALYFGSATELMVVNTSNNALTTQNTFVPGTVLAVSPDNATVVIHDPCRQLFYLYNPSKNTVLTFPAPGPTISCNANNQPIYPNGVVNPVYATTSSPNVFPQLDPGGEVNPPYSATFTEDSQNLYITYSNPPSANTPGAATLFVYSRFTGWHTCTDNHQNATGTNCPVSSPGTAATTTPVPSVAVTVPDVGIYTSTNGGTQSSAFSYCSTGPNNTNQNPNSALNPTNYYPPAGTIPTTIDQLAATMDGQHIIGATAASGTLTDIGVNIPAGACPLTSNLQFTSSIIDQQSLATANIASINQVLTSPTSELAFVTYYSTTPGASNNTYLPAYAIPCTQQQITDGSCSSTQATAGQITQVTLAGTAAGAPIAGVFSPDTNTFYVSTDQDDLVHIIATNPKDPTTYLKDTVQTTPFAEPLNPGLIGSSGTSVSGKPIPAFFLADRPRPLQGTGETN